MKNKKLRIRAQKYVDYQTIGEMIYDDRGVEKELQSHPFLLEGNHLSLRTFKEKSLRPNLKKHLPFLIYYKDVLQSEDEEVQKIKSYLSVLFAKWVEIIPDRVYKKIENITYEKWKILDDDFRAFYFISLMSYYDDDEFEDFIKDLIYFPFMKVYGYRPSIFDPENCDETLKYDLKKCWEINKKGL